MKKSVNAGKLHIPNRKKIDRQMKKRGHGSVSVGHFFGIRRTISPESSCKHLQQMKNALHHYAIVLRQGTIGAIFPAAAFAAPGAAPDGVELFGQGFDQGGIIGQDAVLEIPAVFVLRAHARTGQVRTAEIRPFPVHNDALEMDARA